MFVTPPSAEILKDRLAGRGTETKEVIHSRLARAVEEADGCEVYDYLVVNDDLDACVEEVHHIILSERSRMARRLDTIEEIKNQLKTVCEGRRTMIHPSYVELMKVVNKESDNIGEEPVVNSRYSIVIAAAKRARQIIAGAEADGGQCGKRQTAFHRGLRNCTREK